MIPEHKMQEFVKIVRAIAFSVAVVAFCMLYRDGKRAAKQKRMDAAYVKDFSEYILKAAVTEAETEKSQVANLENTYMEYDTVDLSRLIEVMCADSAKYADALVHDSNVVLKFRGNSFDTILEKIKNSVPDSELKHDPDTNANTVTRVASYYEQYKQHVQILSISRQVLNKKKCE